MLKRSFGTHDGTFHADDVTAAALLVVFDLIDQEKIIRTRDPKKLDECEFVCDVGGIYDPAQKRFDHHQNEYQGDLASAGMIWLYLKEQKIIDSRLYEYGNHSLIYGIDAHDNGITLHEDGVCTFSHIIANFVPIHQGASDEELYLAFLQACAFAIGHLKRVLARYDYILACKDKVEKVMQSKEKVLIFDEPMPWQDSFFDLGGEKHPALFIIMPSGEHWKLRGIPPNNIDRMAVRMPLPEAWAGLRDESLQEITGIRGAIFCHKGRFISVWETKEDALKALDLVLQKQGE